MTSWLRRLIVLFVLLLLPTSSHAVDQNNSEFTQAEKAFEAHKYKDAEQWYRRTLPRYQKLTNLAAYIEDKIGECCQYQHRTDEAVLQYRKIHDHYPESPLASQAQEKIARTYYQAGEYGKAAPEFESLSTQLEKEQLSSTVVKGSSVVRRAKALSERHTKVLGYTALCYYKSGNKAKALLIGAKAKMSLANQ